MFMPRYLIAIYFTPSVLLLLGLPFPLLIPLLTRIILVNLASLILFKWPKHVNTPSSALNHALLTTIPSSYVIIPFKINPTQATYPRTFHFQWIHFSNAYLTTSCMSNTWKDLRTTKPQSTQTTIWQFRLHSWIFMNFSRVQAIASSEMNCPDRWLWSSQYRQSESKYLMKYQYSFSCFATPSVWKYICVTFIHCNMFKTYCLCCT